jgi:26S proteasome regulatory subunit N9
MFLSFTPLESLTAEERYVLATDMALASITGEETYNFGEVIATPILSSLQNTPNAWMFELVHVLNRGDIDQFNQLVDTHRAQYAAQPSLSGRHEMVKQKVVLLSLVNIAFERPSHDRQISFADIAAVTKIPLNQVEWVLMRAMSLKLIRGTIDEVDGQVNITWVQPRVLDKRQLALLGSQLDGWTER